jgi:hypothetical protein
MFSGLTFSVKFKHLFKCIFSLNMILFSKSPWAHLKRELTGHAKKSKTGESLFLQASFVDMVRYLTQVGHLLNGKSTNKESLSQLPL